MGGILDIAQKNEHEMKCERSNFSGLACKRLFGLFDRPMMDRPRESTLSPPPYYSLTRRTVIIDLSIDDKRGGSIIAAVSAERFHPACLDLDSCSEKYRENVYLLMYFGARRAAIYALRTRVPKVSRKGRNRLPVKT